MTAPAREPAKRAEAAVRLPQQAPVAAVVSSSGPAKLIVDTGGGEAGPQDDTIGRLLNRLSG